MIINHNISALNSFNRLHTSNNNTANSMGKLSSGLRINKASDDAAGLAISEKMRAQIRGLGQAQKNIQDGISLIQAVESGLSTIQEPNLLRLRELAIQPANDTLTDEDRREIQKEVIHIKQGINEIANNTKFNNIDLLNRTVASIRLTQETGYTWETIDTGFSGILSGINKIGERYVGVGENGNVLTSLDGKNGQLRILELLIIYMKLFPIGVN